MVKDMQISLLYDFYKELLTPRQADSIDLYYNQDLSLSEISENLGITRQGVRDNIKRAEQILLESEGKLHLAVRFMSIKESIDKIDIKIKEIENSPGIRTLSDEIKLKINEILTIISDMNEI